MTVRKTSPDTTRLDKAVADQLKYAAERNVGYRERALSMYPWICGRCMREFTRANVRELTVHHRNHNHDDNPVDGSNWELLCLYCHDNEHQRGLSSGTRAGERAQESVATGNPFAGLKDLLKK